MNYTGKWKLHSVMTYDDDNMPVFLTPQEYLDSPMPYIDETDEEEVAHEIQERRKMLGMFIKICEDGRLYMMTAIPEDIPQEEIDKAVSAGVIKLVDGAMADEPMSWELRDGELWFDTGIEGEVYDEEVSSWVNPIDENGFFNFMNFRFIKED